MTRRERSQPTVDADNVRLFLVVLVALVAGFAVGARAAGIPVLDLGPVYMFTPGVAGLVVCLRSGIGLRTVGLRLGRKRWYVIAALLPPLLPGFVTLLSLGVPGVTFDSPLDLAAEVGLPSGALWTVVALGAVVVVGATVNAVLGFGEEFGCGATCCGNSRRWGSGRRR